MLCVDGDGLKSVTANAYDVRRSALHFRRRPTEHAAVRIKVRARWRR